MERMQVKKRERKRKQKKLLQQLQNYINNKMKQITESSSLKLKVFLHQTHYTSSSKKFVRLKSSFPFETSLIW